MQLFRGRTKPPLTATLGRGLVAGLAGSAVMTGFQKLVEMPLTGRGDSYAPLKLATKLLPIRPGTQGQRDAVNYATHLGLGGAFGVAHGLAERAGLRGQRAVAAVFGALYGGDLAINTALGLYAPARWTRRDWAIDVANKLVLAEACAAAYARLPGRR